MEDDGDIDAPMPQDTARLRYGPFAYCPVLIPKEAFDAFDAENESQLRAENGYRSSGNEELSFVAKIFHVIDTGVAVRRDDVKRILAKDMKVDEWRAHWREAVIIRPELGRSGPKKRLPNSK